MSSRALLMILGLIVASAPCAGCSSPSGGSSPTGGASPFGGAWLVSCNNPFGASAGSVTPSCIDYYAQAGPAFPTLQSTYTTICTAGGGTILGSPCPSTASAGGCRIGPEASDPYAEYSVDIFYSPQTTEASVKANCASQGDPYVPSSGGTTGSSADSGKVGAGSGSSSGAGDGGSG